MLLEDAASREVIARAAYEAAARHPDHLSLATRPWEDVHDDDRAGWAVVAEAAVAASVSAHRSALETAMRAGVVEVGAERYMRQSDGSLKPLGLVPAQKQLEDEMVRKILFFACDLSAQVARFKGHTFEDVNSHQSLLDQEYGAKAGGKKGNVGFVTQDGLMKVTVKMADQLSFGSELQSAKKLIDECLLEWGAGSHEALRGLINSVFNVEKEGQINRNDLFKLLSMEVQDDRWNRAMDAIRDSIRVIGQKAYLGFHIRPDHMAGWSTVTIALAAA